MLNKVLSTWTLVSSMLKILDGSLRAAAKPGFFDMNNSVSACQELRSATVKTCLPEKIFPIIYI